MINLSYTRTAEAVSWIYLNSNLKPERERERERERNSKNVGRKTKQRIQPWVTA
jgi:hypothetical protein